MKKDDVFNKADEEVIAVVHGLSLFVSVAKARFQEGNAFDWMLIEEEVQHRDQEHTAGEDRIDPVELLVLEGIA